MHVIAIANQKGGVGKTTTSVTLAHGLALRGYKTLLIDLDSQGNVADCLHLSEGNELYQLLYPGQENTIANTAIETNRDNFHVIRSDKTTVELKMALSGVDFREYVLADKLENTEYDVVLFDCAPSIDILHTAAMVAADWLLIPTKLDQLSVKGVRDVLHSLAALKKRERTQCELLGILPTFFDRVTQESQQQLHHLAQSFGQRIYPPIPQDTKCREASRYGQTLWEYTPNRALSGISKNGNSVGGYIQVVERLIKEIS